MFRLPSATQHKKVDPADIRRRSGSTAETEKQRVAIGAPVAGPAFGRGFREIARRIQVSTRPDSQRGIQRLQRSWASFRHEPNALFTCNESNLLAFVGKIHDVEEQRSVDRLSQTL
ncbi:hypothetical protein AJ87_34790 [Rhizobium yanglingense]|nr:hypothetical protein AJ87_34790 [Rhizobium yanglingense]